jgi:tRNA-dihydrouridine synthase C
MASVGGFDEAVADFLRVPSNAHVQSLAKAYDPRELGNIPLAVQLMGSDVDLMAAMAREVHRRGAHRIDLNCGCPSNTVTGRGAGSSLLKDPRLIYEVAAALVQAVPIPVTIKMRSGFEDTTLFRENLLAAQESGARYITLHPRTKVDGYGPPARWDLIREAKEVLQIPVVGNGDIVSPQDALRMLTTTGCDALMVGRGSIINPFLFWEIRALFSQERCLFSWEKLHTYLRTYLAHISPDASEKLRINKLKQLMSFLFKATPSLQEKRQLALTHASPDAASYLAYALELYGKAG